MANRGAATKMVWRCAFAFRGLASLNGEGCQPSWVTAPRVFGRTLGSGQALSSLGSESDRYKTAYRLTKVNPAPKSPSVGGGVKGPEKWRARWTHTGSAGPIENE